MDFVFVYGTLKDGFPNCRFNRGERIAGEFATKDHYELYLVGDRYVPWLIDKPGVGHHVTGQVFAVDTVALAEMDSLEGVGKPNGYTRLEIPVAPPVADDTFGVFVYMKRPDQLNSNEVRLGPLASYEPEHAALYTPRSMRFLDGRN